LWRDLETEDGERVNFCYKSLLSEPRSLDPGDAAFFFRICGRIARIAEPLPLPVFYVCFDYITDADAALRNRVFELILSLLANHPHYAPLFVKFGADRVSRFVRAFRSPATFRGWMTDILIRFLGHLDGDDDFAPFFADVLHVILLGFGENVPQADHWICVFKCLHSLADSDTLAASLLPEIFRACHSAIAANAMCSAAFVGPFWNVIKCANCLLSLDVNWDRGEVAYFVERSRRLFEMFITDNHACEEMLKLFKTLTHYEVDAIAEGFVDASLFGVRNVDVGVALVDLIAAVLAKWPEMQDFVAEDEDVVELAMALREDATPLQRAALAKLFVGLSHSAAIEAWVPTFVRCDVIEEFGTLLVSSLVDSMKVKLADGVLNVLTWMARHGVVNELVQSFTNPDFSELFDGIDDIEDEELRTRVGEIQEAVAPFLEPSF
jgi:hypothetical protein